MRHAACVSSLKPAPPNPAGLFFAWRIGEDRAMADRVECVVVGAGIIGLAVARALARAGREVLVLEQERWIGAHTSSRNSEVIHAGLYYPKDSLKARYCVEGRARLYDYCAGRGVGHRRTGKLVVACTEPEIPVLRGVMEKARANGVHDLVWLGGNEARALEPELSCLAAFHSPSTGIIDSHGLMLAYEADAEAAGATIVLRAPMLGGRATRRGFTLEIGGAEPMALDCEILVNSAGLEAPALARRIAGLPPAALARDYYCRGVYFTLSGRGGGGGRGCLVAEAGGGGGGVRRELGGAARGGAATPR
jgi:L-2-hydroxyglutarate oxidase LhgO